jgi:hypothetical protein
MFPNIIEKNDVLEKTAIIPEILDRLASSLIERLTLDQEGMSWGVLFMTNSIELMRHVVDITPFVNLCTNLSLLQTTTLILLIVRWVELLLLLVLLDAVISVHTTYFLHSHCCYKLLLIVSYECCTVAVAERLCPLPSIPPHPLLLIVFV